jgi:hypothetical protein
MMGREHDRFNVIAHRLLVESRSDYAEPYESDA